MLYETDISLIGSFNNLDFILVPSSNVCACAAWVSVWNVLTTIIVILLLLHIDIELNPGPCTHLTVGRCNIRGIRANLSDLRVHLTYQYDIFCISESLLSETLPIISLKSMDIKSRLGGIEITMVAISNILFQQYDGQTPRRSWVILYRNVMDWSINTRSEVPSV